MSAEPLADHHAAERIGSEPRAEGYGLLGLIWSDYEAYCDLRARSGVRESARASRLKAPLRFLVNASLRAQVLFRLTLASPRWFHWFWRTVLLTLHSCELVHGASIGPRLSLPHPYGIGIGGAARIGSGAIVGQNVTLASDMTATGQPQLGDDVILLAGAMVAGPVSVGDGAVVGANSVLLEDLAPGGLCTPARTRVVNRRVNWNRAQ